MFPDSVFLTNGVFAELIKTDVDTGLLQSVKTESKLTPEVIIRTLITAVKDRRKYINKSKTNKDNQFLINEDKVNYGDMAVFRYLYDPNEPVAVVI